MYFFIDIYNIVIIVIITNYNYCDYYDNFNGNDCNNFNDNDCNNFNDNDCDINCNN